MYKITFTELIQSALMNEDQESPIPTVSNTGIRSTVAQPLAAVPLLDHFLRAVFELPCAFGEVSLSESLIKCTHYTSHEVSLRELYYIMERKYSTSR